MSSFAVIGLGNTLRGDDGIGIILIEKLAEERKKLPENVELIDGGTGGFNLIHSLSKFEKILIIDALDFHASPGSYKFFKLTEEHLKTKSVHIDLHERDFLKVIALLREIGTLPKIFVFGIQPKDTSYKLRISKELDERINHFIDVLHEKILFISKES